MNIKNCKKNNDRKRKSIFVKIVNCETITLERKLFKYNIRKIQKE